jgi:hypothetical protein
MISGTQFQMQRALFNYIPRHCCAHHGSFIHIVEVVREVNLALDSVCKLLDSHSDSWGRQARAGEHTTLTKCHSESV